MRYTRKLRVNINDLDRRMETPQTAARADGPKPPTSDKEFAQPSFPLSTRLRNRFTAEVDLKWADLVLVVCYFVVGMIDCVVFNAYSCFVSMQTGNTIFAALGVSDLPAGHPKNNWVKSVVAIFSFCLGAYFFSRFHSYLGPRKRWVLMASFLIQTIFMVITAALISSGVVPEENATLPQQGRGNVDWIVLCPITLLAFQSAGQVVASRILKYNSMTTLVLTSLYADLMSDPHLLTAGLFEDPERTRRVLSVVMLFVGATIGGGLAKTSVGLDGVLWIATGFKGLTVLAWFLWREKRPQAP